MAKAYFGSLERLRDLAIVFVLAALLYAPLCLFEARLSPQLHSRLYGFTQHDFLQTVRGDYTYRPMVFMQHGLAVAMFLGMATVVGCMLWWSGTAARLLPERIALHYGFLIPVLVLGLGATLLLCRSSGAVLLAGIGLVVLVSACRFRLPWLLVGLLLVCPLYLTTRVSGAWSGNALVPFFRATLDKDRAESFECRQINEDDLMERAFEGPPFGWGGWGRNFVHDKYGNNLTIPDGLWIITLGERGLLGLISLYLAMLVPVARFIFVRPPSTWSKPACAPAVACAVVVVLYMIDNLMNAMHNPVFILMAGGLAGLARVKAAPPEPPPALTDRTVFQWSLNTARLRRAHS